MPVEPNTILHLADNGKVKFRPNHKNTFGLNFGLPALGGTCPGATQGPGGCLDIRDGNKRPTCYMAKVVQIYKAVGTTLQANTDKLRGKSREEMTQVVTDTFQAFSLKNPQKKHRYFRLFYSGDVFSEDLAYAIRDSCKAFPDIQFWVYTRSFDFASILVQAPNLAVYLSVDPVNLTKGLEVYNILKATYNNLGLAGLGEANLVQAEKFVMCPETSGKVRNNKDSGACSRCRLCFTYSDRIKLRNIRFKLH